MSRNKSGRTVERQVVLQLKKEQVTIKRELDGGRPLGMAKRLKLQERFDQLKDFLLPPTGSITAS